MKTVGVYTRVSSEEQDAQNQMMAIENYCRAQGWNITAIYSESESAWSSGHQHELADSWRRSNPARSISISS